MIPVFVVIVACSMATPAWPAGVVIGEFMADNATTLEDEDGDNPDWLELTNLSDAPVDVTGWALTDDPTSPTKWLLPALTLAAGEHRLVFASGKDRRDPAGELHTNFQLDSAGEYLALVEADGLIKADEFTPTYPPQKEDYSYGAPFTKTALVAEGAEAHYQVPADGSLGVTWTGSGFVEDGSWVVGSTALGYRVAAAPAVAGALFVNLDAEGLALGAATSWSNAGSAGGSFANGFGDPQVELVGGVKAVSFDGEDALVWGQTAPSGITGSSDWSLEVWVFNPVTERLEEGMVNWSPRNSGSYRVAEFNYGFRTQSGAYWHSGCEYGWDKSVPLMGQWHHLVYTYDGGANGIERVYQDTVLDSAEEWPLNFAPGHPVVLGQSVNGTGDYRTNRSLTGALAVVRIHDGALTPAQITANYYRDAARFGRSVGPDIATDLQAAMYGQNPSVYARLPFNATGVGLLEALELNVQYDDGFVAYLNGTEIARRNAPASPLWSSAATAEHVAGYELATETLPLSERLDLLQEGANVLAIHGMNLTAGDEDFVMLPELTAGLAEAEEGYLESPSPGRLNGPSVVGFVADTKFSADRGFFDAPFQLGISTATPGATIRYTTDGSWPTATHGDIYSTTMTVSATTVLRAMAYKTGWVATDVDTQTYLFLDQVIVQPDWPAGYPTEIDEEPADYGMDPEVVNDPLYSGRIVDDLKSIPTISVVVDREHMFGTTGLFANSYAKNSRDWERPASAELIHPDGQKGFAVNCGVRVQGAVSRYPSNFKHSLSLRFRNDYGPGKLRYPLFADTPGGADATEEFDLVMLRSPFSYTWMDRDARGCARAGLQRDQVARDIHLEMGHPAAHGLFAHIYINGMYWGVYNVCERPDADFLSSYQDGDDDDYDAISGAYGMYSTSGDKVAWKTMLDILEDGVADDADYATLQQYMDVDNFIDYMMINLYFNMNDWDNKNYKVGRKRGPPSPFQFYLWDAEMMMPPTNGDRNGTNADRIAADGITNHWSGHLRGMLVDLKENAEFRRRFGDHIHKHFFNGGVFTPEAIIPLWNARTTEIQAALVGESARWGDFRRDVNPWNDHVYELYTIDGTYAAEMAFVVNDYLPARYTVVLDQFKSYGLYPNLAAPEFSVNATPQHGGVVLPTDAITLAAAGTIYYTLDGSEFRSSAAGAAGQAVTFVAEAAAKKSLVPTTDIGATWRSDTGYDETGWAAGASGVGYERGSGSYASYFDVDVGTGMYGIIESCYVRIPFNIAAPAASYESLTLRARYDDGFVAYLDGTKIADANAPASPAWDAAATGNHDDGQAVVLQDFDASAHLALLTVGDHVLAIHALNDGASSSDFLISVELVGQTPATGGGALPNAIAYTGPITLTGGTGIKAAAYNGSVWSAVTEAFFQVLTAAPGDIIITELLPNAVGEDDYKEWFELFNTTDAAIDINGWTIADNGPDAHTINNGGPLIVPARGYLVLGESTDLFLNAGAPVDYAYGADAFTLANDGDEIILLQAGEVIHAVGYENFSSTPTLVADVGLDALPGIALGMAQDYYDEPALLWQAQFSLYGAGGDTGTPGADNDGVQVGGPPDTTPPALIEAKFARREVVFLRFDEPLEAASAQTTSNYSIDQGIGAAVAATQLSLTDVVVVFGQPLASDVAYTITVQNVADTKANAIVSETGALSFHTPAVSITEIMYDNRGVDLEWVELYNTTGAAIDISGWYLTDDASYPATGTGQVTLPPGTVIAAGQRLVVNLWNDANFGAWQMPAAIPLVNAVLGSAGALNNGGDNLALYDAAVGGALIDGSLSVNYPDLSDDGESLEKIDELFPWGDADTVGYNFRKCVTPLSFTTD
ncbi:lamin tail domain-containing protein [Candidatus Sumerlaeota bacterium]